ncbi:hypothetical protein F511_18492 [Dorcoceras hygrometricum]|uniref:Uncharacterized protein n=1 Tax=Dorcoceras hygrometricum TaxID=472368 RepID=A0A2Z7B4R0_9LAMI|nr:hypothetical protein F511_18492 [Dorcoceras hygrometricum]
MASFVVNTLQVNFDSVLNMDNAGMVKMFKSLEESGLRGLLGVSGSVFEDALSHFSQTQRSSLGQYFSGLPSKAVVDMKLLFSATDAPFKPSNKNKDMKIEYRLLHDIVAKSLSAKAGSFDAVTTEKFEMMVVIRVTLKVNWAHVLFNTLAAMVSTPGKQSQGYAVQLSLLLETLVKADHGESVALHTLKSLTNKRPKQVVVSSAAPAQVRSETSSDADKVPLTTLARTETEDKKPKLVKPTVDQAESTPPLVPTIPVEAEGVSTSVPQEKELARRVSASGCIFAPMEILKINWVTHFLPIDPADKEKGVLPYFDRPNPVEEHYLLIIQDMKDKLSKITSMKLVEEFAKFENLLLPRAEMEKVNELLQRRELIWYKMVEQHMRKVLVDHWKDFNKDKPSANQDLMSIRLLEAELAKDRRSGAEQPSQEEEQSAQEEETVMIEQQTQERSTVEKLPPVVQLEEEAEAVDSLEHQAQEEEQQAPEAGEAGPIPSSPTNSIFSVHSSDSVGNNEECQVPVSSNLHIVQYTENRANSEADEDFAQAGPQPVNFSSPKEDFDVVAELKLVKRVVTSLESTVNMMRDDQTYMKYDSNIFRRAFYKKMDEVVTSVSASQTVLGTDFVRQFTEIQQYFSSKMNFVKLQLAELVNHLKELSDAKKGEGESSKKRRLLSKVYRPVQDRAYCVDYSNRIEAKLVKDKPAQSLELG